MQSKPKKIPSFKGRHHSQETKEKIRLSKLGKHHSEETKKKMREKSAIGNYGFKKGHTKSVGIVHSQEFKDNLSKRMKGCTWGFQKGKPGSIYKGENHYNWKGGISNNPYPKEFNRELKLKIRTRDNFICCLCRKTEREELEELNRVLCVNHIDFNKDNCSEKNLNTLCLKCNIKINRERDYWTNYFNQL